ncbi:MAG: thioredoxin [bacterium]
MNGVKDVSGKDFTQEVLKSDKPVLVDFFAEWCGPCRAFAPALEGLAKTYEGRVSMVKVNVDNAQDVAARYGVQAVPTLVLFNDGKAVATMVGVPAAGVLKSKLDAVAAEPAGSSCGSCGCCCG